MKRKSRIIILLLVCFLLCSCGKTSDSNSASSDQPSTEAASSNDGKDKEKPSEENSDTVSSNGVTIKIVAAHKTKDSNGDPIVAAEFLFTNENADPISFMSAARVTAFQNGIELHKDEMFLEKDYDWDTFYTEIKDGATISVFHAFPLQNKEDSIDIKVDLLDAENWTVSASTSISIDLDN